MGSHRAMDPNRHEVPKHHQERTWAIYGKSVPQLFLERAAARPAGIPERGRRGMRRKTAQHHEQNGQNSRRVATNFI